MAAAVAHLHRRDTTPPALVADAASRNQIVLLRVFSAQTNGGEISDHEARPHIRFFWQDAAYGKKQAPGLLNDLYGHFGDASGVKVVGGGPRSPFDKAGLHLDLYLESAAQANALGALQGDNLVEKMITEDEYGAADFMDICKAHGVDEVAAAEAKIVLTEQTPLVVRHQWRPL